MSVRKNLGPKHVGRSSLVAMGSCLALSLLAVAPVPEPVERPKRSLLFGSFSQHPWIYIPDAVKLSLAYFVLCGPDPFWIFGLFDTWCPLSLSKWGLHGSISVFPPYSLSLSLSLQLPNTREQKLFVYPSVNLQEVSAGTSPLRLAMDGSLRGLDRLPTVFSSFSMIASQNKNESNSHSSRMSLSLT